MGVGPRRQRQRRCQVQAQLLRSPNLGEEVLMWLLLAVAAEAAEVAYPTILKARKRGPLHSIEHPDVGPFFSFCSLQRSYG